jgi:hypothetical protein
MLPIWMPPLSFATILTILFIIGAAQADKLPSVIPQTMIHPVGFILTVLIAISLYEYNSIPLAVALVVLLLSVWAAHHKSPQEGFVPFVPSGTIDWVNNDKQKWFVERVLRETPVGIQDKNVATYPVQTESSSSTA